MLFARQNSARRSWGMRASGFIVENPVIGIKPEITSAGLLAIAPLSRCRASVLAELMGTML